VTFSVPFHSFRPTEPVTRCCADVEENRPAPREAARTTSRCKQAPHSVRKAPAGSARFSRSTVRRSSSWCAVTNSVPPGVSYAPRDFMPTNRFFNQIRAPYAMLRGNFIQRIQQFNRAKLLAIHRNGACQIRIQFRLLPPCPEPFPAKTTHCHIASFGALGGIFQFAALVAQVPDVCGSRLVNVFLALLHGNFVFFPRRAMASFARINVPFAPGVR